MEPTGTIPPTRNFYSCVLQRRKLETSPPFIFIPQFNNFPLESSNTLKLKLIVQYLKLIQVIQKNV